MADPKIKVDIAANVSGQGEVGQLATTVEKLAGTLDGDLKTSALASAAALRQLAQKDAAVQNFIKLKQEARDAANGLLAAQQAAEKLGTELAQIEKPTRVQAGQLQKLYEEIRLGTVNIRANQNSLAQARVALDQYGISTNNLGEKQRALKQAIGLARDEVQAMVPAWRSAAASASDSAGKQVQAAKQIEGGLDSLKGQLGTLRNIAAAALGGGYLGGLAKDVAATADAYNNLQARIKLVTGEGPAFEAAFNGVAAVAQRTSSSLESTGNLFAKLAEAGKAMGVGQAEALKLTETVNQAVQLSGASAQASDAAITQFIQGLQSGVLRGDEFNSVMEQSPRLAKALSDGLGVTTKELRKMAEAGQLSSETVIKALKAQADTVASEFTKLPPTVGRAIQNLSTSWALYVGETDKATGVSSAAASAINGIASNLDNLARVAALAGLALTASLAVTGAAAFRAYVAEAALAAGATNLLSTSIEKIPKNVNIAVAITGFEAGYQLGSWLYTTSEYARKLGASIVAYAQFTVSSLQFVKEAAAAVFTSDTIEAAATRYANRVAAIHDIVSDMWVDAKEAPKQIGDAVDQAAGKTAQLGVSAKIAGDQVAASGVAGAAGVGQIGKAAEGALGFFQKLLAEAAKPQVKGGAIDGIVDSLKEAKAKGLDLNALLAKELPSALEKLSGPELAKFRQDFAKAMQEGGLRGKELETGLTLIGNQAAKSLGVDVVAASSKMGDAFKDADEKMRLLILSLPALKAAGVDTGRVVSEALSKMLDGAKNKAEIDAVTERVQALRKVLGEKVADGLLDQAKQKSLELQDTMEKSKPGINGVREAMIKLGVTSDESLKDTAKTAKEAYDAMAADGKRSARELADGFKNAADKAIAANAGIAPSWVTAGAAARGYTLEIDAAGKATLKAANDGTKALGQQKDALEAAAAAAKALAEVYEKYKLQQTLSADLTDRQIAQLEKENALVEKRVALEQKRLGVDKEGFSTDKSGGRIAAGGDLTTLTGIAAFLKSAGVADEAKARSIAREFADSKGDIPYLQNPGQRAYGGDTISMALLKAAERYTFGIGTGGSGQTPSTVPTPSTQTVNVRITLPNGSTETVPTTQAGSEALMAALQSAKLSAGI